MVKFFEGINQDGSLYTQWDHWKINCKLYELV